MPNIVIALARMVPLVIVTAFLTQSSVPLARAAAPAQQVAAGETFPGFEPTTPPVPLPEFKFNDSTDRVLSPMSFRGKVVVLNFWATWCAPCVREMPSLDRLQAILGGPRFEVVALSLDRGGVAVVAPFYARYRLANLGQYFDPASRSSVALGVRGLPTTLLVDAHGREIGRVQGPAEWDSKPILAFLRRLADISSTTSASAR